MAYRMSCDIKNTIGWRIYNIATQKRIVIYMEVEIVTLVVKGSARMTVNLDQQEYIQVGSRGIALRPLGEEPICAHWNADYLVGNPFP